MRFLSLAEVLELHRLVISATGGTEGLRDLAGLESAIAQPRMTFAGQDLYPTLAAKAAALGYSLIRNHPFVDGNKRVGHAAMEAMLLLNGIEFEASVDAAEAIVMSVAAGTASREDLLRWIETHIRPTPSH